MANTGRQATSASNIEQETMESEDPKATRSTRHQIMQRKKRMEELLRSAYSSAKDHLSHFPHYNTNGLSLFLESGRGNKLSSDLKNYIQKLLKVNMEGPYGAEWPAEEKVKRREMSSSEALYIFVYNKESVVGFVHYRFTIEEDVPVLYVYELQLEPAYQGKGLGKFLMQLVELIACNNSMGAVVLTVQKQNTSAINFYLNKLSYNISSISPSKVYQLMGVTGQEKSYEILCKTFDDEAKAVLEES
ncbi:putative transferase transcription regulator GNAT family [Helianthus annuus]|uniref:N-alpha-acetyltransferase 40 n=2 Tax=Helianthus annuus TaxID=4232 RepID=A0A251UKA3_HELAN|nr:N-alpha-acetyltransferase 40 isoform X1 [Helianthus annuus]KAF5803718.1 putative transferase transcription regulator GNAT family [Helianthus annuus]KAJ0561630.1 putative transferase transcription regulator GNAT family [Helianthus annuus]KAJ0574694.1 putative transferase transcription regulator GNAT family [Helianthus annuus]KAJ0739025.1 putative transferase transcription regulator GNAT family [Helianthus annuus]KAJ0913269.1 putative transferase transcription regulator GNAT family [Helianthu